MTIMIEWWYLQARKVTCSGKQTNKSKKIIMYGPNLTLENIMFLLMHTWREIQGKLNENQGHLDRGIVSCLSNLQILLLVRTTRNSSDDENNDHGDGNMIRYELLVR